VKHTYPVEVLWCPNLRGNGWSFHPTVRKKLLADTHGKSVLHLFGGASTFGIRLDVDPVTRPDVIGDAWLPPFRPLSFDVVIIDPPYFHLSAQTKTALLRAAGTIARERVIWWHTVWISASGGVSLERAWLVRTGDSCHVRCLQYFTIAARPGPVKRFLRGPAMKYNRWLAHTGGVLDVGYDKLAKAGSEDSLP
jgi:hypothetical protein